MNLIVVLVIAMPVMMLAGILLVIFVYPVIKALLVEAEARRGERRRQRDATRPDGRPFPPMERGLCRRCGVYDEKVYNLPDGQKLCADCYYDYDPWDLADGPHRSDEPT